MEDLKLKLLNKIYRDVHSAFPNSFPLTEEGEKSFIQTYDKLISSYFDYSSPNYSKFIDKVIEEIKLTQLNKTCDNKKDEWYLIQSYQSKKDLDTQIENKNLQKLKQKSYFQDLSLQIKDKKEKEDKFNEDNKSVYSTSLEFYNNVNKNLNKFDSKILLDQYLAYVEIKKLNRNKEKKEDKEFINQLNEILFSQERQRENSMLNILKKGIPKDLQKPILTKSEINKLNEDFIIKQIKANKEQKNQKTINDLEAEKSFNLKEIEQIQKQQMETKNKIKENKKKQFNELTNQINNKSKSQFSSMSIEEKKFNSKLLQEAKEYLKF